MIITEKYYPVVVKASVGENYTVLAQFSDGTIHKYNMKGLIDKGGVFAPLKNPELFKDTLTVMNQTVAWDLSGNGDPKDCIDVDPLVVYASEIVGTV